MVQSQLDADDTNTNANHHSCHMKNQNIEITKTIIDDVLSLGRYTEGDLRIKTLLFFNNESMSLASFPPMVMTDIHPISSLDKLLECNISYERVIFCNSLLSSSFYKHVMIKVHKLLHPTKARIISYDFLLRDETLYTDVEIFTLTDMMGYNTALMDENVFKGKLQKYCFDRQVSKNLTTQLVDHCKQYFENRYSVFDSLLFLRTECNKSTERSCLEPRLRDEDGFRRRASGVLFRKTEKGVDILLLKRRSKGYTFPGGGMEKDEEASEAVRRECFEECGAVCEVVEELGCVTDTDRKTKTAVFIARVMELKSEYPENHRRRRWFSREYLGEIIRNIDETEFFGKGLITTKAMLDMTWSKVQAL